ncbi:MAG: hypothetical protein IJ382_02980, partial [Flavobacteriales bacterium]|nr:hypothetical protein [Flavobacteriales bacterium]
MAVIRPLFIPVYNIADTEPAIIRIHHGRYGIQLANAPRMDRGMMVDIPGVLHNASDILFIYI